MIYFTDETSPNIKAHLKEYDDAFITFFHSRRQSFDINLAKPAVEPQEAADL